jgi:hypothetical protein
VTSVGYASCGSTAITSLIARQRAQPDPVLHDLRLERAALGGELLDELRAAVVASSRIAHDRAQSARAYGSDRDACTYSVSSCSAWSGSAEPPGGASSMTSPCPRTTISSTSAAGGRARQTAAGSTRQASPAPCSAGSCVIVRLCARFC